MSGRHRPGPASQHFLRKGALAASLVRQAAPRPDDLIVEAGAGSGALTKALARYSRRVVAVEIDPALCERLRAVFADSGRVEVVQRDFLDYRLPLEPWRFIANIPYHLTAAIISRVLHAPVPPDELHVIVQREAAERYAGRPCAPETRTSLKMKPFWHVEIVRRLRRTDFEPPPSVDSVLMWMAKRSPPLVRPEEMVRYAGFVDRAFGDRGPAVRDGLRGFLTGPQMRRLSRDLRFDLQARPSDLSFGQWLGLYRFYSLAQREL